MTWICPSCMTEYSAQPLIDGVIGCPACGNFQPDDEPDEAT